MTVVVLVPFGVLGCCCPRGVVGVAAMAILDAANFLLASESDVRSLAFTGAVSASVAEALMDSLASVVEIDGIVFFVADVDFAIAAAAATDLALLLLPPLPFTCEIVSALLC